MDFDPVLLARLQFAFTIAFHIIFPSFTIGLSAYIATLHVTAWLTGHDRFLRIARFWTKIFAVSFGMGVVSGVVLSYELGTNWSRFSRVAGNIIGPLAGYEVLSAFFLEASFLAILLFGGKRVPRWLHVLSAVIVAIGTAISAFWILSANSWMQTPAGHEMRDGVAYPGRLVGDRVQSELSLSPRPHAQRLLSHRGLRRARGRAARYLLKGDHVDEARTMLRMAIGLLVVLAPLQIFLGDQHGLNTLEHQPTKIAAMEAHWDSTKPGDFHIFAWPDAKAEKNHFEISIPHGSSLILTHEWNGLFPGLKDVPPADRPPLVTVFFAFRIMIGDRLLHGRRPRSTARSCGGAASCSRRAGICCVMAQTWWIGFVAVISGWVVTESGRQPWIVQGILRTADATSPVIGPAIARDLRAVRHGLRHHLFRRHLFHQPADRARASTAADGRRAGRQRSAARSPRPARARQAEA